MTSRFACGKAERNFVRSSSVMADVTDLGVHELCLITDETPLYCLCQQGEYGLMVGCDGVACNIEWFHLQCFGLKGTPTTETWLCPLCIKV